MSTRRVALIVAAPIQLGPRAQVRHSNPAHYGAMSESTLPPPPAWTPAQPQPPAQSAPPRTPFHQRVVRIWWAIGVALACLIVGAGVGSLVTHLADGHDRESRFERFPGGFPGGGPGGFRNFRGGPGGPGGGFGQQFPNQGQQPGQPAQPAPSAPSQPGQTG